MAEHASVHAPEEQPKSVLNKLKISSGTLSSVGKGLLFVLVLLGAVAAGYYLRMRTRPELKVTVIAPEPNQGINGTPSTTPQTSTTTPRGSTDLRITITTSTPPSAPLAQRPAAPAPQPETYENATLGIRLTLPAGWQVDRGQSSGSRAVFAPGSGVATAYVEMHDNRNNESLESIERFLSGSPSVQKVQRTQVHGLPAVEFLGATEAASGVALIRSGKIYYFHGQTRTPNFLDSLKFL